MHTFVQVIHIFASFVLIFFFLTTTVLLLILLTSKLKKKSPSSEKVKITNIKEKYEKNKFEYLKEVSSEGSYEKLMKAEKTKRKLKQKQKEEIPELNNIYVVEFTGDLQATRVEALREEISAILAIAKPKDEIVLKLESGGGAVHAYGLAAAQLARIRAKEIKLTVCVDKIAASGGYLMACVANKIISSPFAILGSIGVVASFPNFNKLLQKNEVDYLELTAGEYKRTLTMFGEVTEKGKTKFIDQLEQVHTLFKNYVASFRPQMNIDSISTGEFWLGTQALEKNLVDELKTSDDLIISYIESFNVYLVKFTAKENWKQKIASMLGKVAIGGIETRLLSKL